MEMTHEQRGNDVLFILICLNSYPGSRNYWMSFQASMGYHSSHATFARGR